MSEAELGFIGWRMEHEPAFLILLFYSPKSSFGGLKQKNYLFRNTNVSKLSTGTGIALAGERSGVD